MKRINVFMFAGGISLSVHLIILLFLNGISLKSYSLSYKKSIKNLEVSFLGAQENTVINDSKIKIKSFMNNKSSINEIKNMDLKTNNNKKLNNEENKGINGTEKGYIDNNGEINNVVVMAKPDYNYAPRPNYPLVAKKSGYEGKVFLKVKVLESGIVNEISILASSGYNILDNAAREAVYKWKFIPATKNGKPFACWVNIPVKFELD